MDYKVLIVQQSDCYMAQREFEREVVRFLDQGWNLHGGVSIAISQYKLCHFYVLAQAMVRQSP